MLARLGANPYAVQNLSRSLEMSVVPSDSPTDSYLNGPTHSHPFLSRNSDLCTAVMNSFNKARKHPRRNEPSSQASSSLSRNSRKKRRETESSAKTQAPIPPAIFTPSTSVFPSKDRISDTWKSMLGKSYKKTVVMNVMKNLDRKEDKQKPPGKNGKYPIQLSCFCPRPPEFCRNNGKKLVWYESSGYTNPFRHLVSVNRLQFEY